MTRLALLLTLAACTPSTAIHTPEHPGGASVARGLSMVDAPGTSSGGGVNP